jgi:ribosomal protein S18 acetylase RimI-like enzyme
VAEAGPGFLAFSAAGLKSSGITLRVAQREDVALLAEIYGSTRAEELQQVPWSAEQKKSFTDWQSQQQERHCELHSPNAERLVMEREAVAIGRIYVETTGMEVRLMDITLLPAHRSQGVGTRLMNELLRYADTLQRPVSLHVEPFNPAKRMYERMNFAVAETRGLYEFMMRPVPEDVPVESAGR